MSTVRLVLVELLLQAQLVLAVERVRGMSVLP
jgi:hypothetical protein